ncbi:hypothetical protein Q1695_008030 [Nippostrongylus brasiliensis]|nr:hypothetical protein Q1695_008030 [Nippostrongylus brasiliensis]
MSSSSPCRGDFHGNPSDINAVGSVSATNTCGFAESSGVSARPVAVTDHDHFNVKDNNEFHLEGERQYVRRGDAVNISCPVFGYPTPGIKWTKDGKPLELSDKVALEGIAVKIAEADYNHAGLYTCEAINEYTAAGKTSKPLIIIERMLDVKSELAWIYPLAVIIIIFVLLFIVIGLCELRKRRQNRQ